MVKGFVLWVEGTIPLERRTGIWASGARMAAATTDNHEIDYIDTHEVHDELGAYAAIKDRWKKWPFDMMVIM